jgi:hypothetical protein
MLCSRIFFVGILTLLGACATGQMVSYEAGGKQTNYSKYYDLGVWLEEGKLGLQVAVDHGPTPNPRLVIATGSVTLYLVNLETKPRQIRSLSVVTAKNERSLPQEASAVAAQRARTRVPLGTIPIFDYGTEIPLTITIDVDGAAPKTMKLTVPRLTEQQLEVFGPKGRPPYPWFQTPYFPFEPPLSIVN